MDNNVYVNTASPESSDKISFEYHIEPEREFSGCESAFAWICLLAGYVFCRVLPWQEKPLGGFLFIIALFSVTLITLKFKGYKPVALSIAVAASAMAVSLALVLCANMFLHVFVYLYCAAAYIYFVFAYTGNTLESGFSRLVIADFLKALLVLPFASFGKLFSAMFSGKMKNSGRLIVKIIAGAVIAIVPTAAVLSLLSYDRGFTALLDSIFDFSWNEIFSHLFSFLFGIPIGMYIFGLFISSVDNKRRDFLTKEDCYRATSGARKLPMLTVLTATVPLLVVYVIFFISQWQHYVSGFAGVLPESMSYAEYARDGFFELRTVSVINLAVLFLVSLFMRREQEHPVVLRTLSVIYSVFTFALISTAIAKMAMYIDSYGLTRKRVYATWFMIVLAIVFILIIIKQFVYKIKLMPTSIAVLVVCFALLSLGNTDALIARYNIDRYLNGTLKTVDIYALHALGEGAIPEYVRLAEELDERNGTDISSDDLVEPEEDEMYYGLSLSLREEAYRLEAEENGIFSYTLSKIRAKAALKRAGLIK